MHRLDRRALVRAGEVPDNAQEPSDSSGVSPVHRKRRLVWPALLSVVLLGSALSIAEAAALPPLPAQELRADAQGLPATAAAGPVAPVAASLPTPVPDTASVATGFGPQLEVILPPPPPPPPAAGGQKSAAQRKADAAAAAGSGMTTTQYCDAKYGATSSASSLEGLLSAANAERAVFGLAPLSWSSSLAVSAQDWSLQMAAASNPGSPGQALSHGLVPSPGGQNVAAAWTSGGGMAQSTAIARAHSGWMASPGHCKNILRSSFSTMGAGTAVSADGNAAYTTVNFQ